MKSLKQYIINIISEAESPKSYTIPELDVTWHVDAPKTFLQVPLSYDDDAIRQYLNDYFIEDSPVGSKYLEKFFKDQIDTLNDANYDFDECKDTENTDRNYLPFEGENKKSEDLVVKELDNIILKAEFVDFVVSNVTSQDGIQKALQLIFKNTESSYTNKWKLDLKVDDKDIEYDKNTINQK